MSESISEGKLDLESIGKNESRFSRFAKWVAAACGHPMAFILSLASVVVWAVLGPVFQYSDTWQLVINTGTTVITFLVVFIIQNTQNRDTTAIHLKLDELIRAIEGPNKALMDLEELSQAELDEIRVHFCKLAQEARDGLRKGEDPYRPKQ